LAKYFFLFLILLVLAGCAKISVYDPNNYRKDVMVYNMLPKLEPTFILCSELFASKFNITYEANLICATKGKEARLIKRQIFNTCYFLQPISNVYECV
jgi:hypothetical protein